MSRSRLYIETDVLTEAKKRLNHVLDVFDGVVVAFSGGKDSLACLHLMREVMDERGDQRPVKAVFRDEEIIPDAVVDFVAKYMDDPRFDIEWWAVPMESQRYILGQFFDFVTFDPNRDPVREPPAYALRSDDLGLSPTTTVDQHLADDLIIRNIKGKACIVTGVRAAESILRYRSCVNKLHENYIVASSSKRGMMARPIFDWQENDVFRYFYDRGIDYAPCYDAQGWSGERMRVSTPLHAESAKHLPQLREHAPELYERVVTLFPETQVQERYYREFDQEGLILEYSKSWDAIYAWLDENITDPGMRKQALKEYRSVKARAQLQPESYPLEHVLKALIANSGHRVVQPMRPDDAVKLSESWTRRRTKRKEQP